MPEETTGGSRMPDEEEIKKQRAEQLKMEIREKKQYLDGMVEDREKWRVCSIHVATLQRDLGRNGLEPGTKRIKQEELAKSLWKLKKIECECQQKYKIDKLLAFGSVIDNYYAREIGKREEILQTLEGRRYVFGQQSGQSQQDGHIQQRVKMVAEPQAGYTTGKDNQTPGSPDERVQNQYTAVEVTSSQSDFQSERERLNREHHERQEHKAKVQEDIGQDRPRDHEM